MCFGMRGGEERHCREEHQAKHGQAMGKWSSDASDSESVCVGHSGTG